MTLGVISKQRLTIIVLTYERHDYMRRQLLYYSIHPVHLIFADGSLKRWPDGDRGCNNQMSWEYIHCPGYNTVMERLALANERVATEFVCLLDDEECILWTGLSSAIKTLDAESDNSCAGGFAALCVKSNEDLKLVLWKGVSQLTLTNANPLTRFEEVVGPKHLSAYLVYQVIRSADLKNFASIMRYHNGLSTAVLEVALAGYLSLKGKYSMGNYPYWVRNGGTVVPPEEFQVTLQSTEINEISSKLIEMLQSENFTNTQRTFDIKTIASAIEAGWGYSSQWAKKDSKSYLRGIRPEKNTTIRLFYSVLARAKKYILRFYAFRSKKNSITMKEYGFVEFASVGADNSYEVVRDLLSLAIIWKTFPRGITFTIQ